MLNNIPHPEAQDERFPALAANHLTRMHGARTYMGLSSRLLDYAVSEERRRREDLDPFVRQRTSGVDLDTVVDETRAALEGNR